MGRRKAKQKKMKVKRPTVPTAFKCPFCAHENTVHCNMDFQNGIGELECRQCNATFQASINSLSEPIDVFSAWIDACEEEENGYDDELDI